jgi:hypothetical protein
MACKGDADIATTSNAAAASGAIRLKRIDFMVRLALLRFSRAVGPPCASRTQSLP